MCKKNHQATVVMVVGSVEELTVVTFKNSNNAPDGIFSIGNRVTHSC